MANKKVFTTLDMQAGTSLKQPRLHPASSLPSSGLEAGQAAVVSGKLHITDGTNWYEQYSVANDATITGELTFNRGASTAPFSLHTNARGQLVTGLNADKLDGYDARNALNDGTTHSIPRRDNDNLFHVGASSYTESAYDSHGDTQVANKALVAAGIAKLVNSAPDDLNTLKELAEFMEGTDGAGGLVASIAAKASKAGDTMTGDLLFGDSVKAKFGDSSNPDLEIYHDQFNSFITDSGTGNLNINASNLALNNGAVTKTYLLATDGGSVQIRHDDAIKFETASTGITVTGTATMGGLTVNGNIANTGNINSGGYLYLKSGGSAYGELGLDGNKPRLRAYGSSGWLNVITVDNNSGKLGLGADATSPSGTLHVSTARYGSHLITGDKSDYSVADGSASSSQYGWSLYGNNTSAISSEQLVITQGGGTNAELVAYYYFTTSNPYSLAAALVVGRKYKVSISLKYTGTSAPSVRINDGSTYLSSFATLTTSLATYTTTFEAKHASSAFIAFTGLPSGGTVTIDNLTLQEDSLASATGSDFAVADDLVINNGLTQAGMTLLGSGGARIHFGESGKEAHSRIIGTYNSDKDSSLFFAASNDGTAATVMTLFGNDKSAKFEGGLGVGTTESAAGTITVKANGGRINVRSNDNLVGLLGNWGNSNSEDQNEGYLALYGAGAEKIRIAANYTSYFNGGNVAIGGTTARSLLHVGADVSTTADATSATAFIKQSGATSYSGLYMERSGQQSGYYMGVSSGSDDGLEFARNNAGTKGAVLGLTKEGVHNHYANPIVNSATVAGLQDGACYDFDGSADYIQYNEANVFASLDKGTFSAWVKTSVTNAVQYIFSVGDIGGADNSIGFGILDNSGSYANEAYLWSGGNGTTSSVKGSTNVCDGKWHHIVYLSTGSVYKIYVDGVEETLSSVASRPNDGKWFSDQAANTIDGFDIGRYRTSSPTHYFNGQIRDVKLFPSALDAADIRKLYSGENPKKNLNVELVSSFDFTNWGVSSSTHVTLFDSDTVVISQANAWWRKDLGLTAEKQYVIHVVGTKSANVELNIRNYNGSALTGATAITGSGAFDSTQVVTLSSGNTGIMFQSTGSAQYDFTTISIKEVETLVDFNPQSASSTKWRNEAIPALYNGTVNNATLSQGNSYWNNIKQSGRNVSIGVGLEDWQTSRTALQIGGNGSLNATSSQAAGGHFDIAQNAYINSSGSWAYINTDEASVYNQVGGTHNLKVKSSGTADTAITWTNGLTVENNGDTTAHGKLGVGGVASSCQLRVAGSAEFEDAIFLGDHEGLRGLISWSGAFDSGLGSAHVHMVLAGSNSAQNAGILFKTRTGSAHVDAGVVSASGNWAIGGNHADEKLHVRGATDGGFTGIRIQNDDGGSSTDETVGLRFLHTSTGADGGRILSGRETNYAGANSWADANSFLAFHTATANSDAERLRIGSDGTQNHQGNRIVNSQTVNDSWRTSEPSLRFDGSNDYVQVPIATASHYDAKAVSVWFKPSTAINKDTSGQWLIGFDDSGYADAIVLGSNTSSISNEIITLWAGSKNCYASATASISAEWHHLVVTYNATDSHWDIYLDGVVVDNAYNGTANTSINVEQILIGARPDQTANRFNGEIKDVRIYNRAMEAAEIKGLYNGESTPFVYADSAGDVTPSTANSDASVWTKNQFWNGSAWVTDATLTFDTDHMEVANNNAAYGVYLTPANMGITATVGKRYRISAKLKNGTASGVSVRLQAYPLTGDGLVDHTTTSSFVEVSTEFTATQAFTQVGVWPLSDLNNSNIEFKDFKFEEVGEVAAYTPKTIDAQHSQSAKHKWLDATSNNNHGSITGCTPVGDNDHRGILRVHSNSDAGSAYAHQHLNGTINIGSNNNYQGRIDFNATGGTEFLIDNSYNSNSAKTQFGMKTAGTRLPVLELLGSGEVKATSASGGLKQVARTGTSSSIGLINGNGSSTRFTISHNLGTDLVIVSVREKLNDGTQGQRYAMVETDVRVGNWSDDTTMETNSQFDKVTITFATAPHADADFLVTVIG